MLISKLEELETASKKENYELNSQLTNNNMKYTEINEKHVEELSKIKLQYDQSLQEIKRIYEKERIVNNTKLEEATNKIKSLNGENWEILKKGYIEKINQLTEELNNHKRISLRYENSEQVEIGRAHV